MLDIDEVEEIEGATESLRTLLGWQESFTIDRVLAVAIATPQQLIAEVPFSLAYELLVRSMQIGANVTLNVSPEEKVNIVGSRALFPRPGGGEFQWDVILRVSDALPETVEHMIESLVALVRLGHFGKEAQEEPFKKKDYLRGHALVRGPSSVQ